jgi:protein-histidine N-methyltransferase
MSFSFGFSGDDIEEDPNDVNTQNQQEHVQEDATPSPVPIPARTHDLDELVCALHFRHLFYLIWVYP